MSYTFGYTISIKGTRPIVTKFTQMSRRAANAYPAFDRIGDYILQVNEATFRSQGRRGGGSWQQVTDEWFQRKMRNPEMADARILRARGLLYEAATRRGAKNQTLKIMPDSLIFDVDLPYAEVHDKGRGRMPKRQWLKFTKKDRAKMRQMVRDHLMAPWGFRY